MPFFKEENEIRTKLSGVSLKVSDIGRQQFLTIMRENPEKIDDIFVFGTTCYIKYEGKEYVLGHINEKYASLLNTHEVEVHQYTVTGGYEIHNKDSVEFAQLGINIILRLSKIVHKNEKTVKKSVNFNHVRKQ